MAISTKPRVLFANPPWWPTLATPGNLCGVRAGSRWPFTYSGASQPGRRDLGDYTPYPFFMGYAASYLKASAQVFFRDSIALRESYGSFYAYLDSVKPDFIVIETASPSWEHDAEVIAEIQRRLPDLKVVLTGPLATQGERILSEIHVDAVVKGEYEKGVARVIAGERGVIDFDLLSRDEMNWAPFPWMDYAIWDKYWDANPGGQQMPQLQAWSSRGCPYKCIFCVWPAAMTGNDPDGSGRRSIRHYTADYMRGFFAEALGLFGYRSVYFDDDTFNLGDRHTLEMCGVMAAVGLPWSAMCRADTIDRSTWRVMKEAGCFGVKIGFESGNQFVVDLIVNKRLDLEAAADTVAHLKSLGMTVHGTFTYGLPGETREQMQDTRRYIQRLLSLGMTSYQESGCAEIEGAPLRTLAERGELRAFPGARVDAGYTREANGAEKFRILQAV